MIAPPLPLLPAFAVQAGSTPSAGAPTLSVYVIEIALVFVALYLLLLRPQQQNRKRQEQTLRSIKKGDDIVTSGGIVGEVIHIKETVKEGAPVVTMEDRITIKSGESRIVVERGRIATVIHKTSDAATGAAT